jgi:hypothetical protein
MMMLMRRNMRAWRAPNERRAVDVAFAVAALAHGCEPMSAANVRGDGGGRRGPRTRAALIYRHGCYAAHVLFGVPAASIAGLVGVRRQVIEAIVSDVSDKRDDRGADAAALEHIERLAGVVDHG